MKVSKPSLSGGEYSGSTCGISLILRMLVAAGFAVLVAGADGLAAACDPIEGGIIYAEQSSFCGYAAPLTIRSLSDGTLGNSPLSGGGGASNNCVGLGCLVDIGGSMCSYGWSWSRSVNGGPFAPYIAYGGLNQLIGDSVGFLSGYNVISYVRTLSSNTGFPMNSNTVTIQHHNNYVAGLVGYTADINTTYLDKTIPCGEAAPPILQVSPAYYTSNNSGQAAPAFEHKWQAFYGGAWRDINYTVGGVFYPLGLPDLDASLVNSEFNAHAELVGTEYVLKFRRTARPVGVCTFVPPNQDNDITLRRAAGAPVVTNTSVLDEPGSLRYAVNNACDGAIITFDPAMSGSTINLRTPQSNAPINITGNVTIKGDPVNRIKISGNNEIRTFVVNAGAALTLSSLDLIDARVPSSSGAIYNAGTVEVHDVNFRNNQGGILAWPGSTTRVFNSTFQGGDTLPPDRTTRFPGGGIYAFGVSGSQPLVEVHNSTFSGNLANAGGAIFCEACTLTLRNCTITNNRATIEAGGIAIYGTAVGQQPAIMRLSGTIVAGNTTDQYAPDLSSYQSSDIVSEGHNLIGNKLLVPNVQSDFPGLPSDIVGTPASPIDPLLEPLASNGGSTPTHALRCGSPAFNAGAPTDFGLDQIGRAPYGGRRDIGAFESQLPLGKASSAFGHDVDGNVVSFTDRSSGLPDSWQWDFGDGGTSDLQSPVHTFAGPGSYTVCLTAATGCGSTPAPTTCEPPIASTDVPKPIADFATITSTLVVSSNLTVGEVRVPVNISHTYQGDLTVTLISPAGTRVRLHSQTGGGAADIVGTYGVDRTPAEPLAVLEGETAAGTWTLEIADDAGDDVGTLNAWALELCASNGPALCRRIDLCPSGYVAGANGCVDFNECALQFNGCPANSTCTNLDGGFECNCNAGYQLSGTTCYPLVNECDLGTDTCDPAAQCSDTLTGFTCQCPAGYRDVLSDGTQCQDYNECAGENGGDDCSANAACANTAGSFTCACDPGFEGDARSGGTGCTDIDECSRNTDGCDLLVSCTNNSGGFACGSCPAGFVDVNGDGTLCRALGLDFDFDSGPQGFGYRDDTARGTQQPAYAAGVHVPLSGSPDTGVLRIDLGGRDRIAVDRMSGGWEFPFELRAAGTLALSVDYRLVFSAFYEPDECGQAVLLIDGRPYGPGPDESLVQFCGSLPNVPSPRDTGWQTVTFEVQLGTGSHVLSLSAYNSRKTGDNETTTVFYDDVTLESPELITGIDEICTDRIDNDGDGLVDCADPECPGIDGCERPEVSCVDGFDNDGDAAVDCADADCAANPACETAESRCADGIDNDADGAVDCADADCVPNLAACPIESPIEASFDVDADGFVFAAGTFAPAKPAYAFGDRVPSGGFGGGGALRLRLGGVDGVDVRDIAGAFKASFTLLAPGEVSVRFRYRLRFPGAYEADECSRVRADIDRDAERSFAQRCGTGADQDTGWVEAAFGPLSLSAGAHTLNLGGLNTKKTSIPERTEILFDDVVVTVQGGSVNPSPEICADGVDNDVDGAVDCADPDCAPDPLCQTSLLVVEDFSADTGDFLFARDAFRSTNQPAYAFGFLDAGALKVELGGRDALHVAGMSGGWRRTFAMPEPGLVQVTFRYRMLYDWNYEPEECAEVLIKVDGSLTGPGPNEHVARLCGQVPQLPVSQDTGWRGVSFAQSLAPGTHELVLGGWNAGKTAQSELTQLWFDDVKVERVVFEPEACANAADDDSDGLVDCADPDCVGIERCERPETSCADAFDNDADGTADCADADCAAIGACEPAEASCADAFDNDGDGLTDCADPNCATDLVACPVTNPIDATFNTDADGFAFTAGVFAPAKPAYAVGERVATLGRSGSGALRTRLGGIDSFDVRDMAGAFRAVFTLSQPAAVKVRFWYRLKFPASYEPDECSRVRADIDRDAERSFGGRCGTGIDYDSGWVEATFGPLSLSAGQHTLNLGGLNTKKTAAAEMTEIFFDDVSVTLPGGAPVSIFDVDFAAGAELFQYRDDTFSTANPAYAAAGANAGEVRLGGIDSSTVNGMSGGWRRSFVLDAAATVRVTLSYQLELSASYEPDECSEVRLALDGTVIPRGANAYVARRCGLLPNPAAPQTLQESDVVLEWALPAGSHTITVGGYNNKKTNVAEATTVRVRNVKVEALP